MFVNCDVVTDKVTRTDLKAYYIPCNTIADEVGNSKVSNMVMLGAYVAGTKVLKPETIETMIETMFAGPKAKFIPLRRVKAVPFPSFLPKQGGPDSPSGPPSLLSGKFCIFS